MDLRTKLDVIYSDGGVETNYSAEAQDFSRDNFQATMTTDDFIYVGFRKPVNALYVAMEVVNTINSSLSFEYYGPLGWKSLTVSDDTKALQRNGFMTWERVDDSEEVAVAGKTQHWVRIAADDDIDPVTFQAINLILADDNDIRQEVPALIDDCFYPSGQTSHLLQHVATKNYILSRLKYKQYIKYNSTTGDQNINEWDILDIYEFRQAAVYHVIAQIYLGLSDDPEDTYWAKYDEYMKKFDQAFVNGLTTIDTDDDGEVDQVEKRQIKSVRWAR